MATGVLTASAVTASSPLLGLALDPRLESSLLSTLSLVLGPLAPLVLGIALLAVRGPSTRQGFGLGLILGWALAPIVLAGLCLSGAVRPSLPVGSVAMPGGLGP